MNKGKEKAIHIHYSKKDQVIEITETASIFLQMFNKSKTWEQI